MDSFPLHRLEFKAMIQVFSVSSEGEKNPVQQNRRGWPHMHTAITRGSHSQESSDKVSWQI